MIPAGEEETVPYDATFFVTVRVRVVANVAVTVFAASMATVHVLAVTGVQFADQPVSTEPDAGVAVRVTIVPIAKAREQVLPHERPVGLEVTVPVPLPIDDFVTESV